MKPTSPTPITLHLHCPKCNTGLRIEASEPEAERQEQEFWGKHPKKCEKENMKPRYLTEYDGAGIYQYAGQRVRVEDWSNNPVPENQKWRAIFKAGMPGWRIFYGETANEAIEALRKAV